MQVEENQSSNEKILKFNQLIDALPYIDSPMDDPRLRQEVSKLVQEEMTKSKKKFEDYLKSIPQAECGYSQTIQEELDRIEQQKVSSPFHQIPTAFDGPAPNKVHDWDTWQNLMKKVNLSLSHFQLKNFNLDLLIKFGPVVWKKYLNAFNTILKQLEKETEELQAGCESINMERKLKQVKYFNSRWSSERL